MWKYIEYEMKKAGFNQEKLAKKMGVHSGVISDLKNGRIKKPSFELIEKIATALDVSMDIFRRTDSDTTTSKKKRE